MDWRTIETCSCSASTCCHTVLKFQIHPFIKLPFGFSLPLPHFILFAIAIRLLLERWFKRVDIAVMMKDKGVNLKLV